MNDKLNMDNTIREKLEGFSVAPPAHVWNSIQTQMAAQKRKKRMAYIAWISAAAVVVFAFVAGWYFNEQSSEMVLPVAEQQLTEPENQLFEIETPIPIADPKEDELSFAKNLEIAKPDVTEKDFLTESENLVAANTGTGVKKENTIYNLMESLEALFTIKNEDVHLAAYHQEKTGDLQITASDELLIAENIKEIKNSTTNETGWIVGAHLSPGYSSYSASHGEQYAQSMTYSGNDGNGNMGGGFSVQYKTGKRLHVESGVYYSQNGQKSSNSSRGLLNFGGKSDMDLLYADPIPADPGFVGIVDGVFSNAVSLSSKGIAMNSTAGVIVMQNTPEGASIATEAELANSKSTNALVTDGDFSQVFEFVEIPLLLRYEVLSKRFGIELVGGLNAGFVVGNNAYINNNYGTQNIGSTQDISTLNFSGLVGVGMNYRLGKHISLALEPRLNYYLSSINSNPDITYRPYRIGVYTGVYYEF
jgi:hypothetical protein